MLQKVESVFYNQHNLRLRGERELKILVAMNSSLFMFQLEIQLYLSNSQEHR